MGHPQKKQHCNPSIIDSDLDHRFSLAGSGSSSDSDSTSSSRDSDIVVQDPQPVVVPQKRAKFSSARAPRTPILAIPATPTVTINYAVSFFSSAEMKKASSKRVPKNSSFELRTEEPWDTLKAQLLVKVSDALGDAANLDFSKYDFMVNILRVISKPGLPLASETDYDFLLNKIKAGKAKDLIFANVTITQLEGVADDKENQPAANDKSKKKVTKDPDTLPGNVEKANNIQMLQHRWKCNKRQNSCIGVYCYIDREGNHLSLSHQRLDCWASAMVCFYFKFLFIVLTGSSKQMRGEDFASIDHPPNHRLFDYDSDTTKLTPLLRKRLEDSKIAHAASVAAPTINFSIGKELVDLLRPALPPPPLQAVADLPPPVYRDAAPLPVQNNFDIDCPTLLQTNRKAGPDMTLEDFCTTYELDDAIKDRFKEHRYKHARMLRYLTTKDMEAMKFWAGEIAEVRDAIDRWSVVA